MTNTKTRGRAPLPAADKKIRITIYAKRRDIEAIGGEDATKQLLTHQIERNAKKNTKLC